MTPASRLGTLGALAIAALASACGAAVEPPSQASPAARAVALPALDARQAPPGTASSTPPPAPLPAPPEPAAPPPPALSSTQLVTWVWEKPSFGSAQLGFFRAGARVPRSEAPYAGKDAQPCPGGGKWYEVAPRGFVCDGSFGVTLNLEDPRVVAAATYSQPRPEPLPFGYGMSMGAWGYARVPTAEEQKQTEGDVAAWRKAQADLRAKTEAAKLWPELAMPLDVMPAFLENHAQAPAVLPYLSANKAVRGAFLGYATRLAFVAAFESQGRPFYVTTEHLVVPADRVRAAGLSSFHGVELAPAEPGGQRDERARLPMVWVRYPSMPAFVHRLEGETLTKTETQIPLQGHAEIADDDVTIKGAKYHELLAAPPGLAAQPGVRYLVKDGETTRLDAAKAMPERVAADETWIDVSIGKQTLVVYRGLTPVFATLISSGSGTKGHITPWGSFRVYQKHVSSRMSAEEQKPEKEGEEGEHAYRYDDVPYVQYIVGGIALHAAFWHDRFGLPQSHGCINLAPRDAQYVFSKTLPAIPAGWHGINPGRGTNPIGTLVVLHG